MKKITKRQHTALTKKNVKMLRETLAGLVHDINVEIDYFEGWDPDNQYMEKAGNDYKNTVAYWAKELKAAFREFKTTKKTLKKAFRP